MIVINNYLNQKNDSSLKRLNKTEYAIMIDIFSIINLVTSSFAIDFQSFLDLLLLGSGENHQKVSVGNSQF